MIFVPFAFVSSLVLYSVVYHCILFGIFTFVFSPVLLLCPSLHAAVDAKAIHSELSKSLKLKNKIIDMSHIAVFIGKEGSDLSQVEELMDAKGDRLEDLGSRFLDDEESYANLLYKSSMGDEDVEDSPLVKKGEAIFTNPKGNIENMCRNRKRSCHTPVIKERTVYDTVEEKSYSYHKCQAPKNNRYICTEIFAPVKGYGANLVSINTQFSFVEGAAYYKEWGNDASWSRWHRCPKYDKYYEKYTLGPVKVDILNESMRVVGELSGYNRQHNANWWYFYSEAGGVAISFTIEDLSKVRGFLYHIDLYEGGEVFVKLNGNVIKSGVDVRALLQKNNTLYVIANNLDHTCCSIPSHGHGWERGGKFPFNLTIYTDTKEVSYTVESRGVTCSLDL